MKKSYDVVIIGGGPAGYTAALYSTRAGFSTLVLEQMSVGGQMSTTEQVDNYPGFELGVNGYELASKMQSGAERFGVETEFSEVQELLLTQNPKIIRTQQAEVEARAVVLAMGSSPRKLQLPSETELMGRGISYCATCDGMFFKNKVVAVAGGGNSAAADALTLSRLCKKVFLVHRRDTLRASQSYLLPLQQAGNIEFVFHTEITKLCYDERLNGIEIRNKQSGETSTLDCEGLFVAIGRIPNSHLVNGQLALDSEGYLVADESTCTVIPGVFAAGDIRTKPLRQIVTATADGAVASKFIEDYLLLS